MATVDYTDLINEHFPHRKGGKPAFRENQFEVIRDVLDAFEDPCCNDVVTELPTGAGKTSIAVTVARIMTRGFGKDLAEAKHLLKNNKALEAQELLSPNQSHMITSMKMLQDAYLGDDPTIKLVKGKSNYECHNNPYRNAGMAAMSSSIRGRIDFSCGDAEEFHGSSCSKKCPYRDAKTAAQLAPIALHNFDSFLNQASLGKAFAPRNLLTIDEAHNTEEKLRGFITFTLSPKFFEEVGIKWVNPPSEHIKDITSWAGDYVSKLEKSVKEWRETLNGLRLGSGKNMKMSDIREMTSTVKLLRKAEAIQTNLSRFHMSRNMKSPAKWVATKSGDDVMLEPVDAGRFVTTALMNFGEKRLHLSATFLNKGGSYSRSVNMKSHGTVFISKKSTFPVERRKIYKAYAGRLGSKDWNENFPKAVKRIQQILKKNQGVRGVIHCTSYTMAEQFMEALNDRRIVFYDKRTRESVVRDFMNKATADDSVLLAVALTEGYDFKYDLCRFQTIVRVPYIVPTKCVNERMETDGRFYGWRTSLVLVQTYGRGMRAPDDHCKTYVLDERFEYFVKQERGQLPDWFLEAIHER